MRFTQGKKVTFSIIGAGGRASCYIKALEKFYSGMFDIVAVADPDIEKRSQYEKEYQIKKENLFDGYESFIKRERLSDVVIISTLDDMHFIPTMACLRLGYDIILEKPIAYNLQETLEIYEESKRHPDQIIAICHVLRHTPFFSKIKEIIDSKELGNVIDIQHNENVGYYHYVHSYVRGNWRNTNSSCPFIIAKSCHDFDIILYLLGDKHCKYISSMGDLTFFKKENFDSTKMAPRCIDCKIESECPYSALKIYKSGLIKSIVFDLETPAKILATFNNSPYGKCVFDCDNNVCDHQVSILEFDGDIHATLNVSGFTKLNTRTIKVMCEYGEIRGMGKKGEIEVYKFNEDTPKLIKIDASQSKHGGGDEGFIKDFMNSYINNLPFNSTIADSIESHVLGFAAEESRINHGKLIDISEYTKNNDK